MAGGALGQLSRVSLNVDVRDVIVRLIRRILGVLRTMAGLALVAAVPGAEPVQAETSGWHIGIRGIARVRTGALGAGRAVVGRQECGRVALSVLVTHLAVWFVHPASAS